MFIGNRYYNELNISTVDFKVFTKMQSFDVYTKRDPKEMKELFWVHNKSKNKFSLHQDPDKWSGGRSWVLISQKDLDNSKQIYESNQNQWDKMTREEREKEVDYRYNTSEADIIELKRNYEKKSSNFLLQKYLLSGNPKFSYVYEEGHIEAKIIMNNGNEFKETLQYWCHKQGIEENKLKTFEKTDRVYEDEDVTIEYVHSILGTKVKKTDKEYI